jgi:hypothetical protein
VLTALALLLDAWDGAGDLCLDPREFAVELGELYAAGLNATLVRWLIGKGYVQHLRERPARGAGARTFQVAAGLGLSRASCFVLTEAGLRLASEWAAAHRRPALPAGGPGPQAAEKAPVLPRWDAESRKLSWNGHLVKCFRLPAVNQETILATFEEEGWPPHIDDPLRSCRDVDPKARLHDAIKGLNRNQVHPVLHFGGDGRGHGVVWAVIAPAEGICHASPARP